MDCRKLSRHSWELRRLLVVIMSTVLLRPLFPRHSFLGFSSTPNGLCRSNGRKGAEGNWVIDELVKMMVVKLVKRTSEHDP